MKNQIREPKQSRSVETKNRIITAGYQLFSEVGYYGTNTAELDRKIWDSATPSVSVPRGRDNKSLQKGTRLCPNGYR